MPFSTTFTLTVGSSTNVGPFDIVGQPGSYSVATGVTRATLAAGSLYHNIPDTVTSFDITSTGTCTTSVNVSIVSCPTEGTFIETYCLGYDLYDTFADGSCGSYDILNTLNSPECGYTGGGGGCFIEGTNVTLADGSQVLIETLQVGDVLKSFAIDTLPLYSDDNTVLTTWNTETLTGTESTASIVSITPMQISEIVVINNLLKTTSNHNHLVKHDGIWSFINASNVVVGDIMLDINNSEIEITSVETQQIEKTIYKMDVESLDVFYAENILTHNVKPVDSDGTWDCSGNGCVQAVGGQYSTLSACQSNCFSGPQP
jgi:hypothetical protein